MKRVVIESPLGASTREGIERNKEYARACMRDSLSRDEAPFASHLLYDQTGILDDQKMSERLTGMEAGFLWGELAELVVVYKDNGITEGMNWGIIHYKNHGIPIEYRSLAPNFDKKTADVSKLRSNVKNLLTHGRENEK